MSSPTGVDDNIGVFTALDYVIFGCLFLVSAVIGIYFAIVDRKEKTSENYLLAGRNFSGWPVALSLSASFMSAITVLGTPAENYVYGTMFWWYIISYGVAAFLTAVVFVPVFYKLEVTSIYEYLESRFNKTVRITCAVAFTFQTLIYMGMVMYMPALALNKVTGLSLFVSISVTSLVCTFYTTIGGMKAVVWNDVVQCLVMGIGFLAIIIQGSNIVGGIDKVFEIAGKHGRIDFFHFDFDPRVRHSIWSIWIGGSMTWLAVYGVNQSMVQRYLSCRSLNQAKLSLGLNYLGLLMILSLGCITGLVMFGVYHECDPLTNGKLTKSDQLTPYLVMDIFRTAPGIPGLFVASAYSGTLSTVSTGINSLACSSYEDFIKPKFPRITSARAVLISKILVLIYGLIGCGIAFLVSLLNQILTLALQLFGIIGGPVLGVFCLGFLTRSANSVGSLVGLCVGLLTGLWMGIGSVLCPPTDEYIRKLPLSTAGCIDNYTTTTLPYNGQDWMTTATATNATLKANWCEESILADTLYALSYSYYSTFMVTITFLVGYLVSICTGGWKSRFGVSSKLLAFEEKFCCCGKKNKNSTIPKYEMGSPGSDKQLLELNVMP